jgi:hypothetical protein
MSSRDSTGDSRGDAGASTLGVAKSTRAPPSPRSPLPESRAVRGSRFWALADESFDEEDLPAFGSGPVEELRSPRSGPSAVTLGDFLSPAWLQVQPAKPRAAARRRDRFAPRGRASWLRRAPMCLRSRSRSRSPQGGVELSGGAAVFSFAGVAGASVPDPPLVASQTRPPVGRVVAPAPPPVVSVEVSSRGASGGPAGQAQVSVGLVSLTDSGPPADSGLPADSGPAQDAQDAVPAPCAGLGLGAQGPVGCPPQVGHPPAQSHSQPIPAVECRFGGGVFNWRWIPVGTLDLSSSHPATLADVASWFRRSRSSHSLPRFLCPTVPPMDRGRGEGRAGSKRSFDEFDSDGGRRLEQQLRGRLELAEERRQRECEADRVWDRSRNRSPEWRRSEERCREEERRFTAGPSRPSEQQRRKKVGVKKYSSKSRASTMATITPTPTPPPPP